MFSLSYAWNELRRRLGRTIVTALGLAAGVGLVMGIIGVSEGLADAQNQVLSPLGSVGTNIIVTRTVAPTTSKTSNSSNSSTSPAGGRFFARGVAGASTNDTTSALDNANSQVITDLAKLGKPGTKFSHTFLVPETLATFSDKAVSDVQKLKGVTSAVGALSLQALHETGTVPKIVSTVKTGGNTIKTTVKPPALTASQTAAERSCIQALLKKDFGSYFNGSGSSTSTSGSGFPRGGASSGASRPGRGTVRAFNGFASNPAFEKCLTPAQRAYEENVVVPEQTITQVLNPPTTNTSTTNYSVGGVDTSNTTTGLITKAQLVSGHWFTASAAHQVLVNSSYAKQAGLKIGSTVKVNNYSFNVIGIVSPTLTGDVSDLYFSLPELQKMASSSGYVNEVLVSVKSASQVSAVTKEIKKELPGADIVTEKTLADTVKGSLSNAHNLANDFGTALAIVVLLAAFLIAGLLTLSNVAKRVREIGSLRAIGWSRARVVRQIMAEMIGIGILGGLIGIGVGALICGVVGAIGPGLTVTSTGLSVGASQADTFLNQATTGSLSSIVHLSAPIRATTAVIAFVGALVGAVLAGTLGGWRAARLAPASALRDLG